MGYEKTRHHDNEVVGVVMILRRVQCTLCMVERDIRVLQSNVIVDAEGRTVMNGVIERDIGVF